MVVALYLFLWLVARTMRTHLAPADTVRTGGTSIFIVTGEARRPIPVQGPTVVGRGGEADVELDDPFSSDRHVMLDRVENRLVIEDLGSTNGTFINGTRVQGRRALDKGDEILVGQTIMGVE